MNIFTKLTHRLSIKLKHWWQRNFGHVYLTTHNWKGELRCFRFKAWFGKVNLVWICGGGLVCKLSPTGGDNINIHNKDMLGYGKPFGDWKWSYVPTTDNPQEGGQW